MSFGTVSSNFTEKKHGCKRHCPPMAYITRPRDLFVNFPGHGFRRLIMTESAAAFVDHCLFLLLSGYCKLSVGNVRCASCPMSAKCRCRCQNGLFKNHIPYCSVHKRIHDAMPEKERHFSLW